MIQWLITSIQIYPVRWASLVRCIILASTSFGFKLTSEQIASLMVVVEAILAIVTHSQVTSNVTVDKMVDSKVVKVLNETNPNGII
jgi:hypothetical protein